MQRLHPIPALTGKEFHMGPSVAAENITSVPLIPVILLLSQKYFLTRKLSEITH